MLLLIALLAVTDQFHLDAVLGAFLAGMVLRRWVGPASPALEAKLDAVGYGFFIPIFFVYSGMSLDLRRDRRGPAAAAAVLRPDGGRARAAGAAGLPGRAAVARSGCRRC